MSRSYERNIRQVLWTTGPRFGKPVLRFLRQQEKGPESFSDMTVEGRRTAIPRRLRFAAASRLYSAVHFRPALMTSLLAHQGINS